MIGSLIGGALKLGSAIWGGAKAAKAAREQQQNVQNQMRENQDWFNRRYNEDATQRADAQRLITMTEDALKRRNKAAQGVQAVMGGTNESVAADKEASVKALADTASQITANAAGRKDAIEEQYMQNKSGLNAQLNEISSQKANSISDAIAGVGDAAGGIAGAFDNTTLDEQFKLVQKVKNNSIAQ